MADYYPLIARAVDALSDPSPEARETVYERARTALTTQLRSVDPPLSEADITRERLSLDDAIARVELDRAPAAEPEPEPLVPPTAFKLPTALKTEGRGDAAPRREAGRMDPRTFLPEAAPPPEPRLAPPAGPPRPAPEPPPDDGAEGRERPRVGSRGPAVRREGRLRPLLLALALAVVVGAIAVVAWVLRDTPADFQEPVAAAEPAPAPEGDAKFSDRVAGERPPAAPAAAAPAAPPAPAPATPAAPAPRNDVAVAQRAVLYEEDPNNPQAPRTTQGRALWRLDAVNGGQGQPLETVVRVTVEVPGTGVSLTLLIRRNQDPTLPASHTIQTTFVTPPGDTARVVRDVGQFQLKNEEGARGTPLSGVQIPVMDNVFLMGLSNLKSDVERNTELLNRRNWIDLPIRYASGQRAIVSFEKGISGEQIMAQAFASWQ